MYRIVLFFLFAIIGSMNAYFLMDPVPSWRDANIQCASKGLRLATFDSVTDIRAIVDTCPSLCYGGWADGAPATPSWIFVTGEPVPDQIEGADVFNTVQLTGFDCGCVSAEYSPVQVIHCRCDQQLKPVCEWQDLECPNGAQYQIGDINANNTGVAINVVDTGTIEQCMALCEDSKSCVSYLFAPYGGSTWRGSNSAVCILYATDGPIGRGGPYQILCRKALKAVTPQPTTHAPTTRTPTTRTPTPPPTSFCQGEGDRQHIEDGCRCLDNCSGRYCHQGASVGIKDESGGDACPGSLVCCCGGDCSASDGPDYAHAEVMLFPDFEMVEEPQMKPTPPPFSLNPYVVISVLTSMIVSICAIGCLWFTWFACKKPTKYTMVDAVSDSEAIVMNA